MICASTPRQAARRRIVPAFWGMSGSYSAIRMGSNLSYVAIHTSSETVVSLALYALDSFSPGRTCTPPARMPINAADCAAWPPVPRMESGGSVCRRLLAPRRSEPRRCAARAGRTTRKGFATVTTMSSAEPTRRDFLYIATSAAAAVGAAAAAWPLIAQMNPDASPIAAGAPIEVDLAPITEGQVIKVFWRGKPIFIDHRTKKEIDEARAVNVATLPDPAPDSARVKEGHHQWLRLIATRPHLSALP